MAKHELAPDGYYDTHPWCTYCGKLTSEWSEGESCSVRTDMDNRWQLLLDDERARKRQELQSRSLTDIEIDALISLDSELRLLQELNKKADCVDTRVYEQEIPTGLFKDDTNSIVDFWQKKGLMPFVNGAEDVLVWKHVSVKPGFDTYMGNLNYPYKIGKHFNCPMGQACAGPWGAIKDWRTDEYESYAYVIGIQTPLSKLGIRKDKTGVFLVGEGIPLALYRASQITYVNCQFDLVEGQDVMALLE